MQGQIALVKYLYPGLSDWAMLTDPPPQVPVGTPFSLGVEWLNTDERSLIGRVDLELIAPDGSRCLLSDAEGQEGEALPGQSRSVSFAPVTLLQPGTYSAAISLMGKESEMYIEKFSDAVEPANPGAWNLWDISNLVPAGAKAVQLYVKSIASGNVAMLRWGARKYGSANNMILEPPGGYSWVGISAVVWCEVGPERIIEIYLGPLYSGNVPRVSYSILGYLI